MVFSTLLAAYLVQMFPDRIGKVIIDGVLDAVSYSNGLPIDAFSVDLEDVEKALEGWATYCAAAPDKCVTASFLQTLLNVTSVTSADIIATIDSILATAYLTYDGTIWVNGSAPASPTGWTYMDLAYLIYGALYSVSSWKQLDESIVSLYAMQNNITLPSDGSSTNTIASSKRSMTTDSLSRLSKRRNLLGFLPRDISQGEAVYSIACGDTIDLNTNDSNILTTESVFEKIVQVAQNVSYHFASVLNPRWVCHKWAPRAVERLPLPMTIRPKNVVLVIGNTADTICPYSSAQKLASEAHLGNMARLVKFNAVGHTSGEFHLYHLFPAVTDDIFLFIPVLLGYGLLASNSTLLHLDPRS
jgi:hypothetical protein